MVFKIDYKIIILNNAIVCLVLAVVSLFFKGGLQERIIIISSIMVMGYMRFALTRRLVSLTFYHQLPEVQIICGGALVFQKKLLLMPNEIQFSYKEEIVGRGLTKNVLRIMRPNRDEIVMVVPGSSGFDPYAIEEIVSRFRELNINEI